MTYTQLFEKLRSNPMSEKQFYMYIKNIGGLYTNIDTELELLKGAGAPLSMQKYGAEMYFSLNTHIKSWRDSDLVFVDIETNGSRAQEHEIIEIGAIKVRNGKCIEHFESYVYADFVPENITSLTGITQTDLSFAPRADKVLEKFRKFLGDGIFVAHNVGFDYGFLDYHLKRYGMFGLLNPRLCTIDIAKKTILSRRYALSYLNEFLGICNPISHRAYADALTSLRIFEIASLMFPIYIQSVQDLIDFSKGRLKFHRK